MSADRLFQIEIRTRAFTVADVKIYYRSSENYGNNNTTNTFSAFLLTVFVLCTAVHIDSKEGRLNYIYNDILSRNDAVYQEDIMAIEQQEAFISNQ